MFTMTIVEPTGVPATIETRMPDAAPKTETTHDKAVTPLKLFDTIIAEIGGKIIRADIKRVPTRFIARTMIIAITDAMTMFKSRVGVPQAKAKSGSNVIAKILLKKKTKKQTTRREITTERTMSTFVSVRMRVEPKRVLHTSPERFDGGEKMFMTK